MLINKDWIKSDLLRTKQYVHDWYIPSSTGYHQEVARNLQDESIKRLIVTLPPQFGKSELLCKTYPAWFLGHNPDKSVIVSSYNEEYTNKLSVKCRDFFLQPKFKDLFNLELHPDQQTKHEWMIKGHQGSAMYVGFGGGITGNPADLLLLDDLTKNYEEACSKLKQESIIDWYDWVVKSRLQSDESRIVIVMTRWLKNDLIGKLLKRDEDSNKSPDKKFKVLHYPAIYDIKKDNIRKGKSLWPEKKSMGFLLDIYEDKPSVFMAIYQGNPKDLDNEVINIKWIKYEKDIKSLGEKIFSCRGRDFGYSKTGDYTVEAKIDVYQKGSKIIVLLTDVKRFREEPTVTKDLVVETALNDGQETVIGLESGGTQLAMTNDIINRKELFDYQVRTYTPKLDKISRAMPWILKLEDGNFRFLPGAWNKMVVDEMDDFSKICDHDDIIDAITTAWKITFGEKAIV
jgi:predicted phage terminase large subunit-like protein